MMPVLIAYGYARDDLENLIEDCVGLVCHSERVGIVADEQLSGPGSTFYQRLFAVYATKIR